VRPSAVALPAARPCRRVTDGELARQGLLMDSEAAHNGKELNLDNAERRAVRQARRPAARGVAEGKCKAGSGELFRLLSASLPMRHVSFPPRSRAPGPEPLPNRPMCGCRWPFGERRLRTSDHWHRQWYIRHDHAVQIASTLTDAGRGCRAEAAVHVRTTLAPIYRLRPRISMGTEG